MGRSHIRDRSILFFGRSNGCLSLMAEAIAKKLLPPKTQIFSTGAKKNELDPRALQVLREIGIGISTQEAKDAGVKRPLDIDLIVMLGAVDEHQPTLSTRARRRTTWDIPDPCGEPGADLDAFRGVRDEINARIGGLFLDHWRNLA
jgi:arsenate reductase (thioredoxin)